MNLKRVLPVLVLTGLIILCLGQSTGWSIVVGPTELDGTGPLTAPTINSPNANWAIHETVSFDPTAPAWGENYRITYTFPREQIGFQYGQHILENILLASDIGGWKWHFFANHDTGLLLQLSGLQADTGNGLQPFSFNSQFRVNENGKIWQDLTFDTLKAGSTLLVDLVVTGGGERQRVDATTDRFVGDVTVWQSPLAVVPEPATLGLAGVGLGLTALLRRGWHRMRLA